MFLLVFFFLLVVERFITNAVSESKAFVSKPFEQTSWWQLSASGSAFYVWGCWADVRGSQKSSVRIILLIHASHMFVGDVMPSCLVHHKLVKVADRVGEHCFGTFLFVRFTLSADVKRA
ncbi:Leucine--tRNA ligase [Trichinella pseudospiralis]